MIAALGEQEPLLLAVHIDACQLLQDAFCNAAAQQGGIVAAGQCASSAAAMSQLTCPSSTNCCFRWLGILCIISYMRRTGASKVYSAPYSLLR